MKLCDDFNMMEMLKVAYIGFADFQDGIGEADIGLDMRKFSNPHDIVFHDKIQFESITKKMDTMMKYYDDFKKKVEEERQLLHRDLSQI